MEEHELWIVGFVNELLGPPIASLLGFHFVEGEHIIPMQVVMATISLLVCLAFFGFLSTRLSVENPGKLQQVMEVIVEFLDAQLLDIIGEEGRKFLKLVGTMDL